MSNTNTGGPAFPSGTDFYGGPNKEYGKRGLTLRDYFAAKAMQELLSDPRQFKRDDIALAAYDMADAMMKARKA